MPKLDLSQISFKGGSSYPGKLAEAVGGRFKKGVGDAGGLTQFGVNIVRLEPQALSSLRHYHMEQDEFAIMLSGTCVLIDDDGEHEMQPGDCAAWPAGEANGHHLVNKTDAPATFLVVGTRTPTETCFYSDLDMMVKDEGNTFTRKDGSPLTADQIGDDND
ncbi:MULTISPECIES: cupin domain-containing protein [unclassified Ruegeria]|uniref:cupin domain-containing protein n=1 Tax=unclassified Ruegeria TaxID=2625375 RepID=UPI0014931C09|nr:MULTISPECIES: cupin domain-containing protein [unclassified Ruegeria]NOD47000.1 cupin domain-containing protein [Ruegeria sp. HKCCD5849]NOD51323.1 cupin domain-containing protein [Ruegeria sp. HKCCD5851]NOD68142.1 cupin domain-containing protein [Ruegeria sp. HKCCD7303]